MDLKIRVDRVMVTSSSCVLYGARGLLRSVVRCFVLLSDAGGSGGLRPYVTLEYPRGEVVAFG